MNNEQKAALDAAVELGYVNSAEFATKFHEDKYAFRHMFANDPIEHPAHYTAHPSGVECIQVVEHMSFNLGNAVKYIWRADLKGDAIEDLKKARWYIDRELGKRDAK